MTIKPTVFCLILLGSLVLSGISQTNISGIINTYSTLTGIDTTNNTITLSSASHFSAGDTLVIVQMKGATIDTTNSSNFGDITNLGGAGLYEINVVESVLGNTVTLEFLLTNYYDPAGTVQVVYMPVYQSARLTGNVSSSYWDGTTGGVLALSTVGNLNLNGRGLLASNRGSLGGSYPFGAGNGCNFFTSHPNYYYANNTWEGSPKGEGVAEFVTGREYGRGPQANGGGGGNDHNSGGGGGAHLNAAGDGGENQEPSALNCDGFNPGIAGNAIVSSSGRIFMGGGGGSGHKNNAQAGSRGDGGSGGGIIIIIAGSIEGNGGAIVSRGQNGFESENDGGGGGGAGGTIIISTSSFGSSTLNIRAFGGDGGDALNIGNRCYGPGGGGSGGEIYVSAPSLPGNVGIDTSEGVAGITTGSTNACNGSSLNATDGLEGSLTFSETIVFSNVDPSAPLPVELIYFDGSCYSDHSTFKWATATEVNADFFEIQWSEDLQSWEPVKTISAAGNSTETVSYETSTPALSGFYRLRQVDFDGAFETFNIIELNCNEGLPDFEVFPNPTSSFLNIQFERAVTGLIEFAVYSSTGAIMKVGELDNEKSVTSIDVSNLPSGMYIVELKRESGNSQFKFRKD